MNATSAPPRAAVPTAAPEASSRDRLVRESWRTWANLVTAVRVAVASACFVTSALTGSEGWSWAGLAVYWTLDVADGAVARALRQETRIGAQLDILSDRLCLGGFYANFLHFHPGMAIPVAMHLLQFVVLDQYLSHQFMRWPCISPNYFYEVDRRVWLLNWSVPGKVANGAVVAGAVVLAPFLGWSWVVPALASLAIISLKVWSIVLLGRLPAPEPWLPGSADRSR